MTSNVQQLPGTARKAPRRTLDWEVIERDYRAGVKSISQIAREQDVNRATIRYHAKRRGWKRDLSAQVQQRAKEKLSRESILDTAGETGGGSDRQLLSATTADQEIVECNAEAIVHIVRGQRRDLTRVRRNLSRLQMLLEQYLQAIESWREGEAVPEASLRLVQVLGPRETVSDLTVKLIRGLAQLIALERQAFGLDERDARAAFEPEALSEQDQEILEDYRRAVVREVMQELAAD